MVVGESLEHEGADLAGDAAEVALVELVHLGPGGLVIVAAGHLAQEIAEEGAAAKDARRAEHLVDDDKVVDLGIEQGVVIGD